jgi:hypothetical protein
MVSQCSPTTNVGHTGVAELTFSYHFAEGVAANDLEAVAGELLG